jgi:L-ribulokinase
MSGARRATYRPDPDRVHAYDPLYDEYRRLHDYLGRGGNDVMARLRAIRNAARGGDR